MATSFPSNLDVLTNPTSTSTLASPSHSDQHINANDAIEALQAKVGKNGSADVNTIDYKVAQLQTNLAALDAENSSEILGLDGNNDLTIEGIENKTTIDSFSKSVYKTVEYKIQIDKQSGNLTTSSTVLILNDGTDIHMSESNIISNTSNVLGNITFEENSGIISLCVTPVSGSIKVRYFKTALKA